MCLGFVHVAAVRIAARRLLVSVGLMALAFTAAACGSDSSLRITPENPTIVVRNGVFEPVEFTLSEPAGKGSVRTLSGAHWSIDGTRVGTIDQASGIFTPSTVLTGTATVVAEIDSERAETSVTVVIENVLLGEGVPNDVEDRFDSNPQVGAQGAPAILYPLDRAVVPQSLKPPVIQWEGPGQLGDFYRIHVETEAARVTAFIAHTGEGFSYSWPIDTASWSSLRRAAADSGLPVTYVIDHWSSANGQTLRSETRSLDVAAATLDGAIYYWELSRGKILRINNQGRETFIDNPAPNPNGGGNAACLACHTISRDGRYMASLSGAAHDRAGVIYDLSADLSGNPAPTVLAPGAYTAFYSTFNPDASRLLTNDSAGFKLVDVASGNVLPTSGTPLARSGATQPEWSPDGSFVAYIAHDNGTAIDFSLGNVALLPVTGPDSFGDPVVVRQADGLANSWPSVSPDSEWIAYGRGTHSRSGSRNEASPVELVEPGSLRMIHRDGGREIVLSQANGGEEDSYIPRFSPFDEGGYFWVVFHSYRPYGNDQVGTKAVPQPRRQLWITAVSNNPAPGEDPSHVPFWLPDQDIARDNMTAYWTLPPPVIVE